MPLFGDEIHAVGWEVLLSAMTAEKSVSQLCSGRISLLYAVTTIKQDYN